MSKLLLIIGDSNVSRWITHAGAAYPPIVDYAPARNFDELGPALKQVKSTYQMVVFAGLTNIVVGCGSDLTERFAHLEAVKAALQSTFLTLRNTFEAVKGPSYFLALPTVRSRPNWYTALHPDLTKLIFKLLKSCLLDVRVLPAYPLSGHDLDSDGIHLTACAGIGYVQHLIDHPRAILEIVSKEGGSDGLTYLSDNLASLTSTVNAHELQLKLLSDQILISRCLQAEEACGRMNVDNLKRLVIIGGPFLQMSEQLQDKLKSQVAYYICLMGRNLSTKIIHVRQFRGRRGAIYDVEMDSATSSERIRHAFSLYYRRGSQGPPPELARISITNSVTYATRVRLRLMKEVQKKHQAANPDLQIFITNYLPHPTLKIREKKGPMSTYNFCETMQKFSHLLSHDFLVATSKFANVHIAREDLTPLFLLLSADLLKGACLTPSSPSEGQLPPTSSVLRSISTPGPSGVNAIPLVTPKGGQPAPTPFPSTFKAKRTAEPKRLNNSRRGRGIRGAASGPRKGGIGCVKNPKFARFSSQVGEGPMDVEITESATDQDNDEEVEDTQGSIVPIDFSKEGEIEG